MASQARAAPAGAQPPPQKRWIRPAQSLPGPTGFVNLPSSETVDRKNLSFGIHRFGIGLLFGWPRNLEYGFSFDLREITLAEPEASGRRVSPSAKLRFFNSRRFGRAAAGFRRKTYYGVYGRSFGSSLDVEGGGSVTNFAGVNAGGGFLTLVLNTTHSRYMFELDGRTLQPTAGWRYMLSSSIAMDVSLANLRDFNNKFDNFSFGLTMLASPRP